MPCLRRTVFVLSAYVYSVWEVLWTRFIRQSNGNNFDERKQTLSDLNSKFQNTASLLLLSVNSFNEKKVKAESDAAYVNRNCSKKRLWALGSQQMATGRILANGDWKNFGKWGMEGFGQMDDRRIWVSKTAKFLPRCHRVPVREKQERK